MADPFTRNCQRCGTGASGGVTGIVDQNGQPYPGGQVPTIPNYGPHPPLKITAVGPAANPGRNPFTIVTDPNDDHCLALRWDAAQVGRDLVAADGTTVLFSAPPETPFAANGSGNGPTTIGGILVTPGGTLGHNPVIVLAIDPDNPPPFTVNDEGLIEGTGDDPTQRCTAEWPSVIDWADGPGNAANTAPNYVIDGKITWVCVQSGAADDTGNLVLWHVEQDHNGVWQWHGE